MKNRLKAFGVHFLLSLTIVSFVLLFLIYIWFPTPLNFIQDLHKIVFTLIAVDIVLGPLLTFIVFKPNKKNLKMDLIFIGLIQFLALSYGIYTSYISRPVYVVFSYDRFNSVSANEFDYIDMKKIPSDNPYLKLSNFGPIWLGSVEPKSISKIDKMDLEFSTALGDGLRLMPQYYVGYEKIKSDIIKASKRVNELDFSIVKTNEKNEDTKLEKKNIPTIEQVQRVKKWLSGLTFPMEKIGLIPIKGRENYAIVAINLDTGSVIDSISEDPWWYQ